MYDFMIIGHRGAAGYEPENTLLSFQKAIDLGVDWIEFDLHRSADGHLVVIHDPTVDRTTGGHGKVSDMTLDQLKKLDAGKGQQIPTFQEVIDLVRDRVVPHAPDKRVKMIPEIKQEGIELEVLDIIDRNDVVNDCLVSSFFTYSIRRCKEFHPTLQTAAIFSHLPIDFQAMALDIRADALFLKKDIVSPALVKECHKDGFLVCIWNEDDPAEIRKYAEMKPDFMSSNYPDRLKQVVHSAPAA